jgi:Fe-S cluster assembly protein SufD
VKLTPEVYKQISLAQAEPAWLLDQRISAWKSFEELPYPTVKDEEWKYTDLSGFGHADFNVEFEQGLFEKRREKDPELRSFIATVKGSKETEAGIVVEKNGFLAHREISKELEKQGIIISDLKTALNCHPQMVEPLLRDVRKISQSKFEALHQAFWRGGMFVYVPAGATVRLPIYHLTTMAEPNAVVFPFTVALVDTGASLLLVDEMASTAPTAGAASNEKGGRQFSDACRYLYLKEDANCQYINIQRWGENVTHFEFQVARLERGAKFSSVNVGLGSQLSRAHVHTILEGVGSEANLLGVYFGHGRQHFDMHTTQDHESPQTTSDLLYKAALKDSAQSSYQGIIRIPKNAQRSDAYQANKNLLLSQNAKARSIPKLEILADDVRCTHSATVGTVDPEETFYLESRGLSHEDAVQMVVEGFFEQVFARIPSPEIQKRLHQIVQLKLGAK